MAIRRADFPLPDVDDPLTAPYFAGAARGELVITRCDDVRRGTSGTRPTACPACGGDAVSWTAGVGPRHAVLVGGRASARSCPRSRSRCRS